jgi:hypothetical protein
LHPDQWNPPLARHPESYRFLSPDLPSTARAWEALKQWLPIDSQVSGVVWAREPYGAWIDLGLGFPALLEIIYIERLTAERYRADDWCPVGSNVSAKVLGLRDSGCIYLWQVKPKFMQTLLS